MAPAVLPPAATFCQAGPSDFLQKPRKLLGTKLYLHFQALPLQPVTCSSTPIRDSMCCRPKISPLSHVMVCKGHGFHVQHSVQAF